MQQCSVCHSPDVQEINAALKSGVADREVERRFPSVTRASLSRHRRNHLSVGADDPNADQALMPEVLPALPPKKSKASASNSDDDQPSFEHRKALDQQRAVCATTWKLIDKALKRGNLGVVTTNLRNLTEAIKSLGAMTGELDKGTNISVNINARAAWQGTSTDVLRWALGRHLHASFQFDPAELEKLKELSQGPCPDCRRFGCAHDPT